RKRRRRSALELLVAAALVLVERDLAASRSTPATLARLAHFGDRPLQFPLPVLHAEGGVRTRLRFSAEIRHPQLRGNRAARSHFHFARRGESAAHWRRTAAPARSPAARGNARGPRRFARSDADDEWLAAGRARPAAARR